MLLMGFAGARPTYAQARCGDVLSTIVEAERPAEAPLNVEKLQAQVKPIFDPKEALLARLLAIRSAKKIVDLAYYKFDRDQAGYLILNEVKEALRRGVNVRFMVDSVGSLHTTHTELLALIQFSQQNRAGKIDIVTFNPPTTVERALARIAYVVTGKWLTAATKDVFRVNHRSHDKILLVDSGTDDMFAIIGTRNIANVYYRLNRDGRGASQDVDLVIRPQNKNSSSDLSGLFKSYYDTIFFHSLNKLLGENLYRIFRLDLSNEIERMEEAQGKLAANDDYQGLLDRMVADKYLDSGFENSGLRVVHELQNIMNKGEYFSNRWSLWQRKSNPQSLIRSLKEQILLAKKSVRLISPYPILSKRDVRLLEKWLLANPGAEFELVTNSAVTNNSFLTQALFDQFVAPKLLKLRENPAIGDRVRVYSYHGADAENPALRGGKLHAKVAIVDDRHVLIGTSNFDPRSRNLNSEMGFWLNSRKTVKQFNDYERSLIAQSHLWGSPEWQTLRNNDFGSLRQRLQLYISQLIEYFNAVDLF